MKKSLIILILFLASCGPSAEEKAAAERATQDSTYAANNPKVETPKMENKELFFGTEVVYQDDTHILLRKIK